MSIQQVLKQCDLARMRKALPRSLSSISLYPLLVNTSSRLVLYNRDIVECPRGSSMVARASNRAASDALAAVSVAAAATDPGAQLATLRTTAGALKTMGYRDAEEVRR